MLIYLCWILIVIVSAVLVYQDFKKRLISTWLVVAFALLNTGQYLLRNLTEQFGENVLFCVLYFGLSYSVLLLYTYIKTRKFDKILDTKIGWGDVWIALAIGICIEPIQLIFFFTAAFILSLIAHLLMASKKQTVPLAAYLIICYLLFSGLKTCHII